MCNKPAKTLALILLALLLCSVPVWASEQQDLIDLEQLDRRPVSYQTTQVTRGTFVQEISSPAAVVYPCSAEVVCGVKDAYFLEYTVTEGQQVQAGDVLVRLSFRTDEIAIARMERALQRMQEERDAAVGQQQEAIDQAKEVLQTLHDPHAHAQQSIAVAILQTRLEQFCFLQDQAIEEQRQELEALRQRSQPRELTAPMDGVVTKLSGKQPGDPVAASEIMLTLVRTDIRLLQVSDIAGELRGNMPVTITAGRTGSQIQLTGRVVAADDAIAQQYRAGCAYILPDPGFGDADLSQARIKAGEVQLENVLLVDRKALIQENGVYYVTVLTDGMLQRRAVTVGKVGMTQAWILTGVAQGQTLVLDQGG